VGCHTPVGVPNRNSVTKLACAAMAFECVVNLNYQLCIGPETAKARRESGGGTHVHPGPCCCCRQADIERRAIAAVTGRSARGCGELHLICRLVRCGGGAAQHARRLAATFEPPQAVDAKQTGAVSKLARFGVSTCMHACNRAQEAAAVMHVPARRASPSIDQ
jgi:hypothetical protein